MSRADLGGIRDIEGLKRRCRIDPTDPDSCWVYLGKARTSSGSAGVYLASERRTTTLGAAVGWLMTGKRPPAGKLCVAMCGEPMCGNPEHRKLRAAGTQSEVAAQLGRLGGRERGMKIAETKRGASRWSEAEIEEIRSAEGPLREIAARFGMSVGYASKLRRGDRRAKASSWYRGLA